jgi:sugar lactone lactonase YvrE
MTTKWKNLLITMAAIGAGIAAHAQTPLITTVAGSTSGYSGDGGAATAAKLNYPVAVALADSGKLYIADKLNNCVRKVSPTGKIATVAGSATGGYSGDGGAATAALLNTPTGVVVDTAKNLYIADQGNNCIRKVSAAGIITTYAGNGTAGFAGDGGAATAAQFSSPAALAIDAAGNIFVADMGNNRIRKVSATGIITTVAGSSAMGGYSGDGYAATIAQLNAPTGVAVTSGGRIYISDQGNNRIRMVSIVGIITTVAGNGTTGYSGDGGPALSAQLRYPAGVAATDSGYIYIAEGNNNAIRKVDLSGVITTIAGDGGSGLTGDGGAATAARLSAPNSLIVDSVGRIYVADAGNNRVRKIAKKAVNTGLEKTIITMGLSLYPNPNNGSFSISTTTGKVTEPVTVVIVNSAGAVVYKTSVLPSNGFLNAVITPNSQLKNGVYLLQIYTATQSEAISFVVQQ